MHLHRWFSVLLALLLNAGPGFGQQAFYGSIVGLVTDGSGAVIPDANVTISNVLTGIEIPVKTNSQGLYQAQNLATGEYTVTVAVDGFQTFTQEGISLRAGQQARINAIMQIGEVSQVVEVAAEGTMINTENATTALSGRFTHQNLVTLPTQGTANQVFPDIYYQLMYTHADVQNSGFTIGGSLSGTNAEVQDGMRVEGQRHYVGGNRGLARPSVESVEEVVVTTTSPSAKYPNPSAIESVIKSGSNDLHGTLMYLHGNKSLNAAGYYTHVKAPFILHQYFGSLGGPIKKNKTFFFFAQQGFYHPNGEQSFSNLPTTQMRNGDLSQLLDPTFLRGSAPVTVIDPQTGNPFPNNTIPTSRINPISRNILNVYPDPNRPSDVDSGPLYQRNFLLTDLLVRKETFNFDTRVDHYFSPTQHTYARFTYFDSPNARTQFNLPGFGGNYFIVKTKVLTVHHTSTLSPTLTNHAMVGLFDEDDPLGPGEFEGTDKAVPWSQQLGIAGIPADQDSGFPWITFAQSAFTTPMSWGYGNYKNKIWHLRDDVSWIRGKHNIEMGVDFRRDLEGSAVPGVGQGNGGTCQFGCLNFSGRWTSNDLGDFLLGLPFSSARQILLPPDFRTRNELAFYAQDDIKLTSNLTASIGMRYDYYPVVRSQNGFASLFDPVGQRLVVPNEQSLNAIRPEVGVPIPIVTADQASYPESLLKSDRMNFGPRASLAYRFLGSSVIRAGFGIYHTPLVNTGRRLLTGPFSARSDYPFEQPPIGGSPVLSMESPYSLAGRGSSIINFFGGENDPKAPRHYNYNLAIERQFGNQALTLEFVGKKSIEPWLPNLNAVPPSNEPFSRARLPYPQLGSIVGLANGAHYNYHGLRANLRRRFAQGLFFDVAYVWSRAIDDLAGGLSGDAGGSSEDPFDRVRDRGTVSYIEPHRLTTNYIYELPFGKKGGSLSFKDSGIGRAMNFIIGGWQTAGMYNFVSARPMTPSANFLNAAGQQYDAPNTNVLSGRPDYTGQPLEASAEQKAQGYMFNPTAFSAFVAPGRYGTAGKSVIAGAFLEGGMSVSQSFFRTFATPQLGENAHLRIGFLFYNAINHSNYANPTVSLASPIYARRANEKTGGDTTGFMRTISFQARFQF